MMEILNRVLNWAIPFVLGGAVTWIVLWYGYFKSFRDGIQCLLRAEIIRQNEKWTEKGYCPIYAKEALSRIYAAYHALNGNDVATGLYNSTIALPEHK